MTNFNLTSVAYSHKKNCNLLFKILNLKFKKKGFTLVELIIVIAVVAVLAGAIFVAIDPARRLHEARNARRSSDVNTILDAIKKYQADNNGDHFYEIAALTEDDTYGIGTEADACSTCTAGGGVTECVDLADMGNNYLATIPFDPKTGNEGETGYYLILGTEGTITIGSCEPEGEGAGGSGTAPTIEIVR